MKILFELQNHYSTATIKKIAVYASEKPSHFKQLIEIFLGNDKKMSYRAAWALSHVAENNVKIIEPYFEILIERLKIKNQHTSIYRSIFKCFQESKIPEEFVGQIFDLALLFMMSEMQEAAVRAYAITVASNCAHAYPELKSELRLVLNELSLLAQSKAVSVRLKRAMKDL